METKNFVWEGVDTFAPMLFLAEKKKRETIHLRGTLKPFIVLPEMFMVLVCLISKFERVF